MELSTDFQTVLATYGSGDKGHADGYAATARFNEPQGLVLLPEDVAAETGYDVVIADSVNHRLRGLSLADGTVSTLAGNGVQRLLETGPARVDEEGAAYGARLEPDPLQVSLSSPWDVVWSTKLNAVVVAMAGVHQIFSFDPRSGAVSIIAGNGLEGLLDGPAEEAWFAQSSGLAEDADGNIWVADSETSALRKLVIGDGGTVTVESAVGKGLFDFGFRDGKAADARLQHPLGVTVLPDGSVAIADTYNGAVRRYDPCLGHGLHAGARAVRALRRDCGPHPGRRRRAAAGGGRGEQAPAGLRADPQGSAAGGRGRGPDPPAQEPRGPRAAGADRPLHRADRPETGRPLGRPDPAEDLLHPAGAARCPAAEHPWGCSAPWSSPPTCPEGVLHITARAAACDGPEDADGEIPDHAACHLYQQDWGIPVLLQADGDTELVLDLRGMD